MIIWELTFEEDYSRYFLPIEKEKETFEAIEEEIFDVAGKASPAWEPFLIIKGEEKKEADITELEDSGYIIINEYTAKCFEELVTKREIELLEFTTEKYSEKMYLMNVIGLLENTLDKENTDILESSLGFTIDVEYIDFNLDVIKDKSIFRIKELPHNIYVTDKFQYICYLHSLSGLSFNEDDVFWRA